MWFLAQMESHWNAESLVVAAESKGPIYQGHWVMIDGAPRREQCVGAVDLELQWSEAFYLDDRRFQDLVVLFDRTASPKQ